MRRKSTLIDIRIAWEGELTGRKSEKKDGKDTISPARILTGMVRLYYALILSLGGIRYFTGKRQ